MRSSYSRAASHALLCLYQHRMMSTSQLQRLLTPGARSPRYIQRQLAALYDHGLVDAVTCGSASAAVWFATEAGATAAEQSGQVIRRPYRMTSARAAGPLREHTLAVNETGIAFATAARERGDTCGPLGWMPEAAHRMGSGATLICDALLSYIIEDQQAGTRTQLQWFVELDRATMPVARLAAKLGLYDRYQRYRPPGGSGLPAWRQRYPRFPRLLVILDGASQATLERRMLDLAAAMAARRELRTSRIAAGVTTLGRLRQCGPFQPVFMPLGTGSTSGTRCDATLSARR